MSETLITMTLYIFCLLSFMQRSLRRAIVAGVFAFLVIPHWYISHLVPLDSPDFWVVYLSAALTDLFIISVIIHISLPSKLCSQIQFVCLLSIAINLMGWIMWERYSEPDFYNWCITVLNFYAVYCMISKEPSYGRVAEDNGFIPIIYGYFINSRKQSTGL